MSKPDYLPKKLNWLLAICPVCKKDYPYLAGYDIGHCGRFDCIYELAMRELKRRGT